MSETSFPASFFFHGSLNDFLPTKQKNTPIHYSCKGMTSVKDAFEATGIPHVEVQTILANKAVVTECYHLRAGDVIELFPYDSPILNSPKSFVLDVHLGGLARLLRMLGIATVYQNNFNDQEIIDFAINDNWAVLTRDVGVLKHKRLRWGYWLRSQQSEEQAIEVIQRFGLCNSTHPFTRCLACGGALQPVDKRLVLSLLPERTKTDFDEFFQCVSCKKIYWKGSHYERMQQTVERLQSLLC